MRYSISIRVTISFVIIILITGGVIAFQNTNFKTKMNQSYSEAPNYPINENGQTYGSSLYAISFETEPDLIRAIGVDGTAGYVLKKDLNGEMPKSPKEALDQQNSRPLGGYDIPLYDTDGKTIIGVFHFGGK